VNFANFEDPDVLERLTGPEFTKYWKETYGVDFAIIHAVNSTEGESIQHCVESEFRSVSFDQFYFITASIAISI
jgi:hypothetical protein